MTGHLVDGAGLVHLLTHLQCHVTADDLAVVQMADLDPAIAWNSFPAPSCLLPGAKIGQVADARFTINDGASLHLQRFAGNDSDLIEAHLDDHDACDAPIEHATTATRALEYTAVAGLGLGLLTYLLTRNTKAALILGGLGAGGGAYLGVHTPKQRRRIFLLSDFVAAWRHHSLTRPSLQR